MRIPTIPAFNRKWMTITGIFVVACGAGLWLHSSSGGNGSAFRSTPAYSGPYSLGDPGVVTPPEGSSFEIRGDGSGTRVAASEHAPSSRTRVRLASTYEGPTGAAPALTPTYPPGANTPPPPAAPSGDGDGGGDGNAGDGSGDGDGQMSDLQIPPFLPANLFKPLPGAKTRGVAVSEWESYRTDVAGKNILVTTDDSNLFRDRNGKLNGNTGDTDASGLNVTDASDAVILGTESADEAPWQTVAQALVDVQDSEGEDGAAATEDDGGAADDPGADPEDTAQTLAAPAGRATPSTAPATAPATGTVSAATAAVIAPDEDDETPDQDDTDSDDDGDSGSEESDFPYLQWLGHISSQSASAIHTDEGTTLASGADALVIGGDGFDDDDNRAAGENIVITRDDGNVVLGGTGNVNAQIGDSEQGAVIMDVKRVYIKGGGAY